MIYGRIDAAGVGEWPCSADDPTIPLGGTPRLYTDLRFNRPDARAALRSVTRQPLREETGPSYPLLLNTGRTVEHWHTRTKHGRVPVLEELEPEAWTGLQPEEDSEQNGRGARRKRGGRGGG